MPHPTPKAEYRYKYFKEIYNTIITLSSGILVASVAFAANLHGQSAHKTAFSIGLGLLFLSIVLQIIILLSNIISVGFNWNFLDSDLTDYESGKQAQVYGKLSGALLMISILLTSVGFICMWFFVSQNV
jgi:hypothetical protein